MSKKTAKDVRAESVEMFREALRLSREADKFAAKAAKKALEAVALAEKEKTAKAKPVKVTKAPKTVGTIIVDDRHFPLLSVQKTILTKTLKRHSGSIPAVSDVATKIMDHIPHSIHARGDLVETFSIHLLGSQTVYQFMLEDEALSWCELPLESLHSMPKIAA